MGNLNKSGGKCSAVPNGEFESTDPPLTLVRTIPILGTCGEYCFRYADSKIQFDYNSRNATLDRFVFYGHSVGLTRSWGFSIRVGNQTWIYRSDVAQVDGGSTAVIFSAERTVCVGPGCPTRPEPPPPPPPPPPRPIRVAEQPSLIIAADGTLHMFVGTGPSGQITKPESRLCHYIYANNSWTTHAQIVPAAPYYFKSGPSIAQDNLGRIHLVIRADDTFGSNNGILHYAYTLGAGWQLLTPIILNPTVNLRYSPALVVDGNGSTLQMVIARRLGWSDPARHALQRFTYIDDKWLEQEVFGEMQNIWTSPSLVRCPDGRFRVASVSSGPGNYDKIQTYLMDGNGWRNDLPMEDGVNHDSIRSGNRADVCLFCGEDQVIYGMTPKHNNQFVIFVLADTWQRFRVFARGINSGRAVQTLDGKIHLVYRGGRGLGHMMFDNNWNLTAQTIIPEFS